MENLCLKYGCLSIGIDSKIVKLENVEILLTKSEFDILVMLASSPMKVYSRRQITDFIHDGLGNATEHSADTHITNIRKKLGCKACCIFCRQGYGYYFDPYILQSNKKILLGKKPATPKA